MTNPDLNKRELDPRWLPICEIDISGHDETKPCKAFNAIIPEWLLIENGWENYSNGTE